MKTSIIIALFAVIFGWSFNGRAQTVQYVTVYSTTNIAGVSYPLQTNQVISVVGYDYQNTPQLSGALPNGTSLNVAPVRGGNVSLVPASQIPQIITGLTNITVMKYGFPGWATFQITTPASANVISNYVPADAIVIPSSATGDVQIILESSADLVNWTAASPGTYGASSATNRFFRVRAVHN
jgi:hypothetical protein